MSRVLFGHSYTYDNANRLTNIQQGTSNIVIGYDDADRRTSVSYPNTVSANANSVTYGYNNASELISLTYKKGTTTLGTLTYTYDLAGNRIKTGGTFARSNIPPVLTTTTYSVNNQQKVFGTTTENYDLNGSLIDTTDAGVVTTYTWNVRNQLTSISRTGLTASFSYDSFGRRTGKTINGTTTNFVYDGLNPVQEKNGATVTANLLTGLGIDEFLTRTEGGTAKSLLPDALGSTIALGDSTGTIQTQYTYEPFGITTQTGTASTNSYKYTGREDDSTGLAYYRARYYQPRLQRFVAEDPIGFRGGDFNLYTYVGGNPLRWTDPLGLEVQICSRLWTPSSFFSPHTFLCVDSNCSGKYPVGNIFSSPGVIRNDSDDKQSASCSAVPGQQSDPACFENCVSKRVMNRGSSGDFYNYAGANCGQWAVDVISQCRRQCPK